MKNFLLAVFGLFAALPPCAANNIKMVTYFPVPYASYNDLKVSGTCDVGLLDDCTLDAGSSLRVLKDASRTNNEGKLEVVRGALSLNGSGSVYGNTLQFGINSVSGGELQFKHNLNVTTMPGSVITSIQVSNQAKLNKLNLFEKYEFPGCDGTDNEINWKRLTVNGAEGVFLVCGAGTEGESEEKPKSCPTPTHYPPECKSCTISTTDGVGNKFTVPGSKCQHWDTATCEWIWWENEVCDSLHNVWVYMGTTKDYSHCTSYKRLSSEPNNGETCSYDGGTWASYIINCPNSLNCLCADYECVDLKQ